MQRAASKFEFVAVHVRRGYLFGAGVHAEEVLAVVHASHAAGFTPRDWQSFGSRDVARVC